MISVHKKRVKFAAWVGIFLCIAAVGYTARSRITQTRLKSMKCYQLQPEGVSARIEMLKASLIEPSDSKPQQAIRMRFDVDPMWVRGSTLAVRSHIADKILYLGPFTTEITIVIDSALITDDGHDIFSFTLLDSNRGQMCLWVGDLGYPFWKGAKRVTAHLWNDRRIDENGIVHTYDIDFEE